MFKLGTIPVGDSEWMIVNTRLRFEGESNRLIVLVLGSKADDAQWIALSPLTREKKKERKKTGSTCNSLATG